MAPVLAAQGLSVAISTRDGRTVTPVRNISLALDAGETLAIVGESGCGKTMTCLALSGLLPRRAQVTATSLTLAGEDLATLDRRRAREVRRQRLAVVFQDATNGLNPVKSVGWQVAEAVRLRAGGSRAAASAEAQRLIGRVGLPDPARIMRAYPHQLSGGMNQRAMIALAVAGNPDVLVADEATTALDVTVQAQILTLIAELQREVGMGVVFVTHDLGIVAQIADRVAVMYAGRIVESGPVGEIFAAPRHPYTAGLIASLPRIDRRERDLSVIEGQVPPIDAMPDGCAFAPRCQRAADDCRRTSPPLARLGGVHAACLHPLREMA